MEARLSDTDQHLAPAVDVANKHVVFRSFRRRQILAKRRGAQNSVAPARGTGESNQHSVRGVMA